VGKVGLGRIRTEQILIVCTASGQEERERESKRSHFVELHQWLEHVQRGLQTDNCGSIHDGCTALVLLVLQVVLLGGSGGVIRPHRSACTESRLAVVVVQFYSIVHGQLPRRISSLARSTLRQRRSDGIGIVLWHP
jgi:hypothetical protein